MKPGCGRNPSAGFTLIELAIVLFIITLLLGGILTPLGQQIVERQSTETRRTLESARVALVGYALRQPGQAGPLPCPDLRKHASEHLDGLEDRQADGSCTTLIGNLPWKTLGLAEGDAWGNHLSYAVSTDWTLAGNSLSQAETQLLICSNANCDKPQAAAAVVISHGRNGFGASNVNQGENLPPKSADEKENANADQRFIMHPPRAADRPGGEFDDLVLPVSADWLRGRLCDPASLCNGQ
jgi:prepilin-type N-terminal cleavage/methylation domain-containing protein